MIPTPTYTPPSHVTPSLGKPLNPQPQPQPQAVRIYVDSRAGKASVEWEAGPVPDMVADAAIALAMEAQTSPMALRMTSTPCCAHRKAQHRQPAEGEG